MSLEAGEAGGNTLGPPHVSVRCLTLFLLNIYGWSLLYFVLDPVTSAAQTCEL